MTIIERKFQEKRFYQPLFPSMWFNQRELTLPEGLFRFFCHFFLIQILF